MISKILSCFIRARGRKIVRVHVHAKPVLYPPRIWYHNRLCIARLQPWQCVEFLKYRDTGKRSDVTRLLIVLTCLDERCVRERGISQVAD